MSAFESRCRDGRILVPQVQLAAKKRAPLCALRVSVSSVLIVSERRALLIGGGGLGGEVFRGL